MADAKPGVHSDDQVRELFDSVSAEAINEYLELMEDTESPRVFHIWALLGMVAALLGKNSELKSGILTVRPNLFLVLIGPPGLKKSTAINQIADMAQGMSLNHGPTDTGGQRHGLMSALTGLHRWDGKERRLSIQGILNQSLIKPRHPSDMVLLSPELGRLWGSSNREMADFFLDLYDGAPIDYETKASTTTITAPLVTLLGATTPSSLANMLPENAASHGILSRLLFIYGDSVHKHVPLPPEPTDDWFDLRARTVARLRWVDSNRRDFGLADSARSAFEGLYIYRPRTDDPRLETYAARRANTLLKVSMGLAALRSDTWVIDTDVNLAHQLLMDAEPMMHKALESFGRNKAYQGRLTIIQFLKQQPNQKAQMVDVLAAAATEMTRREAEEVVAAMATNKEITVYGGSVILGSIKTTKKQ
jgi:hypothetical protein